MKQSKEVTMKKYLAYFEEMYVCNGFNRNELSQKHMVNKWVSTILAKRNIISKQDSGGYVWNFTEPTVDLVKSVMKEICKIQDAQKAKRDSKYKKANPPTLFSKNTNHSILISEQQAIDTLKSSKNFRYEIFRYEKKQIC